jgi:hypothetical protein
LKSYDCEPQASFWDSFPKANALISIQTPVNVSCLEYELAKNFSKLTIHEIQRARSSISDLKFGASSFQKGPIQSCEIANNFTTKIFGREVTDSIGHWIKQGYAAGPFKEQILFWQLIRDQKFVLC